MRPLSGLAIVVTRPRARASRLVESLQERGATVLCVPTVRIVPPVDPQPLNAAAARLTDFHWIVFSSAEAVQPLLAAVPGGRLPEGPRVAAVGPATERELRERGVAVHLISAGRTAESLGAELAGRLAREPRPGGTWRVLFPAAEGASDAVERALAGAGAQVLRVAAYRTVPDPDPGDLARLGEAQWVLLTSPSGLRAFLDKASGRLPAACSWASIGPTTSEACKELGLTVTVEAAEHTADGLVEALVAYRIDGSNLK